ncbi:hypothetical protein [Methylomonas sp. AM2-LC]|uniref:hypothetical protein n=1 Tax=Methylomonas sp. AM2-LC TaxID=3153301 RepID=UPI003265B33F
MILKQISRLSNIIPAVALCVISTTGAFASTVDINFNQAVFQGSPGPLATGTAVDLKISDTATLNVLQFSITASLTGKQELTRLYLDLPTAKTAALTGISVSNPTILGQPDSFSYTTVSNPQTGSEWAATQLIVPNSATAAQTGKNDLLIAFSPTSITGAAGKGVLSETFNLTFAGANIKAADFLSLKSNGFNGFAEIALQSGATSSGTAVLAGVPVPGAIWLFGSALLGFIGFNRHKIR